jgi:hypothetical protein
MSLALAPAVRAEPRRERGWSAGVIARRDNLLDKLAPAPAPAPPPAPAPAPVAPAAPEPEDEEEGGNVVWAGEAYVSRSGELPGEDSMGEDKPVMPLPAMRRARR